MAEEQKPPVAVRITRPYTSDTEFLEHEAEILTRTSVVLLGAQQRPQGVVLRFEIVLKSGESILRGEGRVVGYKEGALGGEAGLTLRFTRLDSRSKTLVDRAATMREARARGSSLVPAAPASTPSKSEIPPAASSSASALEPVPESVVSLEAKQPSVPPRTRTGPPPLPAYARATPDPAPAAATATDPEPAAATPPSSGAMDMEATQVDGNFKRARQAPSAPPSQGAPASTQAPAPARSDTPPPAEKPARAEPAKPAAPRKPRSPAAPKTPARTPTEARAATSIDRPADRDGLLSRLRARAEALSPARVHEILTKPGA